MYYIEEGKKPPKCKNEISTPEELVENLKPLIGKKIVMTGKSRTDGSNFRKIITNHLLAKQKQITTMTTDTRINIPITA